MAMEIERAKIGRSGGNHGTVTKTASVSSSGNFIEVSKEETEILAEARRRCALKNLANPIKKVKCMCGCSQSWNIPLKVAQFFSIRVNIFNAQRILTSNFIQILGAFNETAIREM
jgi:hypothetical protein